MKNSNTLDLEMQIITDSYGYEQTEIKCFSTRSKKMAKKMYKNPEVFQVSRITGEAMYHVLSALEWKIKSV